MTSPWNTIRQILRGIQPLRWLLVAGAVLLLVLRPMPGAAPVYSGWSMVPTLIVPALVPLFFMGLLLDAIMSAVQLSSHPEWRMRYQTLIVVNLVMAILLLIWWGPYFGAVFAPG